MDNSQLLSQILVILRNKRAGKKVIKRFEKFIHDYVDLKKSFALTFPEAPANLSKQ